MKLEIETRLKFKPFREKRDLWIGIYTNEAGTRFICPLPTIGIKVWREEFTICPWCGGEMRKAAMDTGDGWLLQWRCISMEYCCYDWDDDHEIKWPFGDRWMSGGELEEFGYEIA